jgi:hypothetical protein
MLTRWWPSRRASFTDFLCTPYPLYCRPS